MLEKHDADQRPRGRAAHVEKRDERRRAAQRAQSAVQVDRGGDGPGEGEGDADEGEETPIHGAR